MSLLDSKSDYEGIIKYLDSQLASLKAENARMQVIVDAASYCYRHDYIDKGAVLFTGLDKALSQPEGGKK